MVRRSDIQRDSKPASTILFKDEKEKAYLEARNGLLQFDEVIRLIDKGITTPSEFKITSAIIRDFHRIAIQDLYLCAGNYRSGPVHIRGTDHQPPPHEQIPALVEGMCEYINNNWGKAPIHLSSYLMWRTNWIHPFFGGNGRTARAVSHLALCVRLGYRLPGTKTIPEQIVSNRQPYYEALDAADAAWAKGKIDVSKMETLLSDLLAGQLVELHRTATTAKI